MSSNELQGTISLSQVQFHPFSKIHFSLNPHQNKWLISNDTPTEISEGS